MSCNCKQHVHNSLFEESKDVSYMNYGTYHNCPVSKAPVCTCATTTKKPVVINGLCGTYKPSVCTTTTKKPVITTTTKKPVVITTTTKKPAVITTTTKKPAVITTTTKKPGVTTTTKKPVIITTTTKKPVVITTTTKQPVIPVHQCAYTHTVKDGDTLFNIANSNGTDLTMMRKLNPTIPDLNKIYVGQKVCLPKPTRCELYYIVNAGDTLTEIAKGFGTNLSTMKLLNPHISDYNLIYPGQRLCVPNYIKDMIPAPPPPTTTTTFKPQNYIPITTPKCKYLYTVKQYDIINKKNISNVFDITMEDLQKLNPQININKLYSGQQICVPMKVKLVPRPNPIRHPPLVGATTTTTTPRVKLVPRPNPIRHPPLIPKKPTTTQRVKLVPRPNPPKQPAV